MNLNRGSLKNTIRHNTGWLEDEVEKNIPEAALDIICSIVEVDILEELEKDK